MWDLARTTASNGALLLNLEGLATMVIAWIVFREIVDRLLLVGAAAILAGAVVLSWIGHGVSLDLGGLLVAGSCLSWGIDNNPTRRISAADPVRITVCKGLVAGSVNIGLAALLMAIGLWLHLTERHEHDQAHDAIEHDHVHSHDDHHDHAHGGPLGEPHSHLHRHAPLVHAHVHYPDLHHRHGH